MFSSVENFLNSLTTSKIIIIIIFVGLLIYANALSNNFVWDDVGQIINNTKAHSMQNIFVFFQGGTFDPGNNLDKLAGTYYKPMMTVLFSVIYSVFGQQAFYFHFFQVFLHIINAIMVFLLFLRFFSKRIALFLSLLFLVHPINVEAVSYISALQDVLFFFFGFLCLLLVANVKKDSKKYYFTVFLLLLFSLLSKETGIIFVFIIPLYFLLFNSKKFLLHSFTSVASAISYLVMRLFIGHVPFSSIILIPIAQEQFSTRLLSIPKIILFYLQTFLFPLNLSAAQMWTVKSFSMKDFYLPLFFDLLFLVLISSIGFFIWKKKRALFKSYLFFFLWFVTGISLHLQLFPLDMTVAERWFYAPFIGCLGIIGVLICLVNLKNKNLVFFTEILVLIIFIALGLRTMMRNSNWNTSYSLFSHDVLLSDNFYLEDKLGIELTLLDKNKEAEEHFQKSIQFSPTASAFSDLGVVYLEEGLYPKAEEYFGKAISLDKKDSPAYQNLAYALLKSNNPKAAIKIINQGLILFPNNDQLWILLAFAEYQSGDKNAAARAALHCYNLSGNSYAEEVYNTIIHNQPINMPSL